MIYYRLENATVCLWGSCKFWIQWFSLMDFSLLIAPKQILQFYEDGRACVRAAVRACVCVRHFMIEMAAYLCQWVQNK